MSRHWPCRVLMPEDAKPENFLPSLEAIARQEKTALVVARDIGTSRSNPDPNYDVWFVPPSGASISRTIRSRGHSSLSQSLKVSFDICGSMNVDFADYESRGHEIHLTVASGASPEGSAIYGREGSPLTRAADGWSQAIFAQVDLATAIKI